ncbi:MAG: RNA polymerase subunit sigma-70 [Polyangiales bacterium]
MSGNPEPDLLGAARAGDRRAFDALTAPHRRAILGHCYRMLGAAHDAEDATQETLLRAWRHVDGYEGRASLRGWLYAIATRVCFDALARRGARRLPSLDDSAPADPARPPGDAVLDPVWIDALPDAAWCDGEVDGFEAPDATVNRRQSVALAFLAAIQMLPPPQRAALLLHEVAGWRAADVGEALGLSTAAVNSALQRARSTLDARAPRWSQRPVAPAAPDADTLSRYVRAWNTGDPALLAATLREDVVLAMPPMSAWYAGREGVVAFFEGFVLRLGLRFSLVAAPRTNGCPAFASYRADPADPTRLHADGLHVLTLDADGAIAAAMVFLGPQAVVGVGLPEVRVATA